MGEERHWVLLRSPRSDDVSGLVLVSLDQSSGCSWFLPNISMLLLSIQPSDLLVYPFPLCLLFGTELQVKMLDGLHKKAVWISFLGKWL